MQGLYDRIILTYFVACGVSRLARYNVTAEALSGAGGKVKYFEGTPIRHFDHDPDDATMLSLHGIVEKIRAKVAAGEFE